MACMIGITCGWRESESKHMLSYDYARAVEEAGGIPVLLPAVEVAPPESYYERMQGFIFSGGDDLDPCHFGEEPQIGLGEITPRRDSFELALAALVLKGNKPALGICRGIQVLAIAAGGTVHQDLKDITSLQHRQQAPRWYPTHQVKLAGESRLCSLLGTDCLRVNSFHHQSVNQVGQQLSAVGWSNDGLVEALESKDPAHFLIGVQWHPESSFYYDKYSYKLFKGLVEAGNSQIS